MFKSFVLFLFLFSFSHSFQDLDLEIGGFDSVNNNCYYDPVFKSNGDVCYNLLVDDSFLCVSDFSPSSGVFVLDSDNNCVRFLDKYNISYISLSSIGFFVGVFVGFTLLFFTSFFLILVGRK